MIIVKLIGLKVYRYTALVERFLQCKILLDKVVQSCQQYFATSENEKSPGTHKQYCLLFNTIRLIAQNHETLS